ncbi:MAG: DegT/DnrJ/EryC1/StrS family aminotransferase [Acidobacteriia bacterium]|nr:DegT/DnrJ/EryC1/StrS family aminotransferase [Terriglobia bacterium]
MIPVARPFVGEEEEQVVLQVLRSGWLSQGQRVAEFENRFAEYVGAKHAVAVSSCTTGLHLALVAAAVGAGDEVLCPSLSFIATANSIRYVGATPVFVDVDPVTFNLDPNRVEEAITSRTKAILVVHQIGLPAALSEILEIAQRRNVMVIEDAACAIGSAYQDRKIGLPHSFMACFSFHPRKILTTGEGGMLTTADEQIAARLRRLRQHAMTTSDLARHQSKSIMMEGYDEVGFNYRMTDMQAAIGLVQLGRLDGFLARRRALALRYSEELSRLAWLTPPSEPAGRRHNFQSYMIRVKPDAPISRDNLMQRLLERGISTRRGVMSIHREPPYRDEKWDKVLSHSEAVTDQGLILPLFHQMTEQEQTHVIESIREI